MNNGPDEPSSTSQNMQQSPPPNDHAAGPSTKLVVILAFIILCLMVACGTVAAFWWIRHRSAQNDTPQTAATTGTTHTAMTTPAATASTQTQGMQLDTSKNYGNKYANGVLPVGDGKYTTTGAKQGYVYACGQYASSLANGGGGAQARGPWFTNNNTAYNINQKTHVLGSVNWQGGYHRLHRRHDAHDHYERFAESPYRHISHRRQRPGIHLRPQPQPHCRSIAYV